MPVMMITNRTLEEELIIGLQAGADDYMSKPIRGGELVARTEALLRRYNALPKHQSSSQCGAYEIDPASEAILLGGRKMDLPPKEFELALLLFRHPGRLFSRHVLSRAVWNREI